MTWFRNYYKCAGCGGEWEDEWSSQVDDDCPHCGARHMSLYESEDLTEIIDKKDGAFVVMRSADTAEDSPKYEEIARFPTLQRAEDYLRRTERE